MNSSPGKAYAVLYDKVQCAWCGEPMPKGDPLTPWRRKPYHPACWQTAREEQFTPPPF